MTKNLLILVFAIACFSLNAQIWEPLNDAPFRGNHTVSFGLDGIGYSVAGNIQDTPSNQFYSYDPASDTWTKLPDVPGPSRGFGIGDTYDGKAYVGFGLTATNLVLDDLWVFDPSNESWTALASCPCTPRFHPTFVAHNGKIFVGLGGSANGNLNDWWEYDIASDSWSQKPSFPGAVRHHPYQFAIGDYVYTGFGHGNNSPAVTIYNDWYRYDPVTEEWTQMADLPAEGRVAGTQFSANGKGYVLSGDGDNHSFMNTGEFWEYDPLLNEWTELPAHPGFSRWAPSSFILDNEVYFYAGLATSQVEDFRVYKYALEDDNPTSIEDITKNELLISPNPTTDIVTIKIKETSSSMEKVTLSDITGQIIIEKNKLNKNSITLNIQDFPIGVYFLKVEIEDEVISQKIVKQ